MITQEEFHADFLQDILSKAESSGILKPSVFFETVCEYLTESGDLSKEYQYADYFKTGKKIEVSGYDYDDEREILTLLTHDFFQADDIQTLTKQRMDAKFDRLENFYRKSISGLYTELEETSEAHDMAYRILHLQQAGGIKQVRLMILTDGKVTRNLDKLLSGKCEEMDIHYRIIDIEYLYKIYLSNVGTGDFEISVDFPFLHVNSTSDEYQSYLSCIPGDQLAEIYEKHGQKLFEQNVRTFLQFRGKVNKGLRNTIAYNPEMFFAYNNGITATATDVATDNNRIVQIKNFQIVNGAQTTAAIHAAYKLHKKDLSSVSVQMKLSVVNNNDNKDEFVAKVSEYANTQNKINKSDFFSNSPFHKQFKDYSARIWAPAIDGSQHRTRWYYERVRGEYLNSQAYLTPAMKKKFLLEYPKKQLLDKTFLSKSENAWEQKPDIVSKGAQYSFAEFAKSVTGELEKNEQLITENYYKYAICRVIMFRATEKIISNADWYDGGFRAQTVAYSMAYLSYYIKQSGQHLNFNRIWEIQELPEKLTSAVKTITENVYNCITNPLEGNANITQWCKQQACWSSVKDLSIEIDLDGLLVSKEDNLYQKKQDNKDKKLESGIEMQAFIVQLGASEKSRLLEYYNSEYDTNMGEISTRDLDILRKYAVGQIPIPTERQSYVLYMLYKKAVDEGVTFD